MWVECSPIVSEVTFGETSNGAAVVQGSLWVLMQISHATFATGPRGYLDSGFKGTLKQECKEKD
ncbi:Transcription factor IIIB 70 kDa subunit [Cyberlindnera fabianii]|uniref:Transcription factor IIIB 70 kDa subunit n=1 Tax=Cyberlindnera fabianii TaxID=36022 RepID=A0A1V2LBJ6_CYBFA|nr:Transcription factor IIIB 70 kDa subunit [Cyberlindnera fabianii]